MADETIAPRMFEYRDGKSDKFWCIELNGNSHTVRYGRVGTDGQSKTKEFADGEKAKKDYEKLIGQKTKKGYAEVEDEAESRSAKVKAKKETTAEHKQFIDGILEDPDDLAGYGVYADFLEENEDPRGEFIRIGLQLEDESTKAAERKKLQKREKELIKAHGKEWVGDLDIFLFDYKTPEALSWRGNEKLFDGQFARGFLDSLHVQYLLPDFAKAIRRSPEMRMLRSLKISYMPSGYELQEEFEEYEDAEWDEDESPSLMMMAGAAFDNLRSFILSEEDGANCHIEGGGIEKLIKKMPRLEVLQVDAHDVDTTALFKLKQPHLKSLTVQHTTDYDCEALCKNKSLSNLEEIFFYPHAFEWDDDEPYLVQRDGEAFGKYAKNFPNLKHLTLRSSEIGDAGLEAMLKSGLIGQLKTLDMMYGTLTAKAVDLLLEHGVSNLESLNVGGNYIPKKDVKRLKDAGLNVTATEMFDGEPDLEDEREHLWYGDIE